jgi:ubiquitin-like modifier-activating enzyme ATG7
MQYTPFASDIELPFYSSLASLKLNHELRAADPPEVSCRMQIRGNALLSDE